MFTANWYALSDLGSVTVSFIELVRETVNSTPNIFRYSSPHEAHDASILFHMNVATRVHEIKLPVCYDQYLIAGTGARPDCYVPQEQTVVEIALSLYDTENELLKDVLKCLLMRDQGRPVSTLVLLGGIRESATRRKVPRTSTQQMSTPFNRAVIELLERAYGLRILVFDLVPQWMEISS